MLNRPSIKDSVFLLAKAKDMLFINKKYCADLPPNDLLIEIDAKVVILSNLLAAQAFSSAKKVLMDDGLKLKVVNGSCPAIAASFLQNNPILKMFNKTMGEKNIDYLNAVLFRMPTIFNSYVNKMRELANDQKLSEDQAILLAETRDHLDVSYLSALSMPIEDETILSELDKLQEQLNELVKAKRHRAFGLVNIMYAFFQDDLLKTDSKISGFNEVEQILLTQAIQYHYQFSTGSNLLPSRLVKAVSSLQAVKPIYSISISDLSEFLTWRLVHIADFLDRYYKHGSQFYRTYEGLVSVTLAQEDINHFINNDICLREGSDDFVPYKRRLESYFQIPMRFIMPIREICSLYQALNDLGIANALIQSSLQVEELEKPRAVPEAISKMNRIQSILQMKILVLNVAMDASAFVDKIDVMLKVLMEDKDKSIFTRTYSPEEAVSLIKCLSSIQSYLKNISGSERVENTSNFNSIIDRVVSYAEENSFNLALISADKKAKPAYKLLSDIYLGYQKRLEDAGWHVEAAPVAAPSSM